MSPRLPISSSGGLKKSNRNKTMTKPKYIFIYGIIVLAIASRLIPHLANLSAITALGMFAAVYLPKKQAIAIPLLARLGSDILIGFFSWPLMIAVYAAHLMGVGFGLWIKRSREESTNRWLRILFAGFGSAAAFFLITNFVAFYPSYYPQDLSGMVSAYVNGLPFLRGTVIGDVGFSVALFGSLSLVRYISARRLKVNSVRIAMTDAH
jgi:hypothetical protein